MDWEVVPILSDVIRVILAYSPRFVFAAIVLALGWIVGRLGSFLIKNIVGKIRLESTFRKTSIGRAILRAGYTPSSFFALVGKGAIYLSTALFALKLLAIPVLTDSAQIVTEYIPSLIGGALILIAGFTLVDWISGAIERGVASPLQSNLLSGLVRTLLYFVIITIALSHMKIDVTILYIFAQALAWSLAIAIGIVVGWNLKDRAGLWLERVLSGKGENDWSASDAR